MSKQLTEKGRQPMKNQLLPNNLISYVYMGKQETGFIDHVLKDGVMISGRKHPVSYDDISGVPITISLIKQSGAKPLCSSVYGITLDCWSLSLIFEDVGWEGFEEGNFETVCFTNEHLGESFTLHNIKYFHQLQNTVLNITEQKILFTT